MSAKSLIGHPVLEPRSECVEQAEEELGPARRGAYLTIATCDRCEQETQYDEWVLYAGPSCPHWSDDWAYASPSMITRFGERGPDSLEANMIRPNCLTDAEREQGEERRREIEAERALRRANADDIPF